MASLTYKVVDTAQSATYNNTTAITAPKVGAAFYGQDAQYKGFQPSYTVNNNGTVSDNVTGLMWTQSPATNVTMAEALAGADAATTGGYTDWRLPTIKELYSLIEFNGYTGTSTSNSDPYLDQSVFNFSYGDTNAGLRLIDAQYLSSTTYVGKVMNNQDAVFGVNFADGRIKGYPTTIERNALYVRGNPAYGQNSFADNHNGTVTDAATGLMWSQGDSGQGMAWKDALAYAENSTLAGYSDWRLPNAKELQSLIDYSRAPDAVKAANVGPALNPVFTATNTGTAANPDYGYEWTSTTHVENGVGNKAVYLTVGEAWGYMQAPNSTSYTLMDVHGAGAQRSDFKAGDPSAYPHGYGPQGDEIDINNYVRLVRDVTPGATTMSVSARTAPTGAHAAPTGASTGAQAAQTGQATQTTATATTSAAVDPDADMPDAFSEESPDESDGLTIGGATTTTTTTTTLASAGATSGQGPQGQGQQGHGPQGQGQGGPGQTQLTDGADSFAGTAAGDSVGGGKGADTLFGAAGNDRLGGGQGHDTLNGGDGDDTLMGGRGNDVFVFSAGDDKVMDFSYDHGDHLALPQGASWSAADATVDDHVATLITANGQTLTLMGVHSYAVTDAWFLTL